MIIIFKNGPTPASFSFIFGLFQQKNTFFTTNQCEKMSKCSSKIRRLDSNPRPFKHESSPKPLDQGFGPFFDYHTDKIQWQISIYATSYGTHNRCIGGTNNKEKFFFCSKFSISAGALFR